ncbi:MAG: ABC transporter permease [Rhodomicrobiaceae bacterium]
MSVQNKQDADLPASNWEAAAAKAGAAIKFMLPLVILVLLWELAVRSGLARASVLPAPSTIVARAWQLVDPADPLHGPLIAHILTSLYRAVSAFVLGVLVAVPLGFALGLSPGLYRWGSPIISVLLPLPAVAWTPIMLVALGQGDATIINVCFLGAVFPILYSTIQAVRAVSKPSIWVVRSMGAGFSSVFFRVLIPASLPTLMAGFKLGIAHSWRTLVAAEMLAAMSSGLGYMIFAARAYMDTATMFVGIVCLAVIGMTIEHGVFGLLENATVRKWHGAIRIGGRR